MSTLLRPVTWNGDIRPERAEIRWLWPGLLAEGNLTLLTGGWKAGKTTLVSLLLDRRNPAHYGGTFPTCQEEEPTEDGNDSRSKQEDRQVKNVPPPGEEACPLLLNRPVRTGATLVISEEDEALWLRRQRRLQFGPNVGFWCRPFAGRPTADKWLALLDQLLQWKRTRHVDLVVLDPLAMFVPANENHPSSLLAPLTDLQRLTEAGLAVLLLHHPAKKETRLGHAARGSGALSAYADILLELRIPRGDPATRRRRLHGFSRFEETPNFLSLELNPEGTDYAVKTDSTDDEVFRLAAGLLLALLPRFPHPVTRPEILARWPTHLQPPTPLTLWRWLTRLVGLGLVERTGKGTKRDAFRYRVVEARQAAK